MTLPCNIAAAIADRAAAQPQTLAIVEPGCRLLSFRELHLTTDAIARGFYPGTLAPVFRSWRKPPRQLAQALDALWADAEENQAVLAAHALAVLLEPPVAPPTQKTLEQMAEGQLRLPRPTPPS